MKNRKFLATFSLSLVVAASTVFCSIPVQAAEITMAKSAAAVTYGQASSAEIAILKGLFDYEYYKQMNPDVVAKFGDSKDALFNHFVKCGLYEGRSLSANFNVSAYASAYSDLKGKFGSDIIKYYIHYAAVGSKENRPITTLAAAANAGITVTSVADPSVVLTPAAIKAAEAKGITDPAAAMAAAPKASSSGSSSGGGGSASTKQNATPTTTPDSEKEPETVEYEGVKIDPGSGVVYLDGTTTISTANEDPTNYENFTYAWTADTDQVTLTGTNTPWLKVKLDSSTTLEAGDKVKVTLTVTYHSKADGSTRTDTPEYVFTVAEKEQDKLVADMDKLATAELAVTIPSAASSTLVEQIVASEVNAVEGLNYTDWTVAIDTYSAGTTTLLLVTLSNKGTTLDDPVSIAVTWYAETLTPSVIDTLAMKEIANYATDPTVSVAATAVEHVTFTYEEKDGTDTDDNFTVSAAGLVTAASGLADGTYSVTVTITATSDDQAMYKGEPVTKDILVTLTIASQSSGEGGEGGDTPAVTITSVTLNKATTEIAKGGTETLTATVVADPDEAANKAVTWTVTGNDKVSVEGGVITVAADATTAEAIVTATSTKDSAKSASCTVTITE